jgi:hypothetical protein
MRINQTAVLFQISHLSTTFGTCRKRKSDDNCIPHSKCENLFCYSTNVLFSTLVTLSCLHHIIWPPLSTERLILVSVLYFCKNSGKSGNYCRCWDKTTPPPFYFIFGGIKVFLNFFRRPSRNGCAMVLTLCIPIFNVKKSFYSASITFPTTSNSWLSLRS